MLLNQGKLDFSKMRDLTQLKKDGIDLSTTSNEVAKLFDAILYQMYGFFDAPEVNGVEGCLEKIHDIDPAFPLSNVWTLEVSNDPDMTKLKKLKAEVKTQCENLSRAKQWTPYEKAHMKALIYRLEGFSKLATESWLDLIVQQPKDLVALKSLNNHYIITGNTIDISNPFIMCRKEISTHDTYYPLILSHEAFGLEEKGQLNEALNLAKKSLGIYSWNSWATHCIAHVFDTNGDSKSGLDFMDSTRNEWVTGSGLACHNYWHNALLYLNEGQIMEALDVYDREIFKRVKDQYFHFCMSDAVSFLLRVDLENKNSTLTQANLDLTERWDTLMKIVETHVDYNTGVEFYDAHFALGMMGCHKSKDLSDFLKQNKHWVDGFENRVFEEWEIESFSQLNRRSSDKHVTKSRITIPLIESMIHYMNEEYQECVNILYPLRNELKLIGGSRAQNDIFHQLLASALLKSGDDKNLCRLKLFCMDRKDVKQTNYYQRIERKLVNSH